jgi:MFS family permease
MFLNIRPLKNSEFRKLYLGQMISLIGTQMTIVTIPFQVYALTKSTAQTGLISLIEFVCLIATVFWGGALADNFDRRRLLIISEVILAALIATLVFNSLLPQGPSLIVIYIAAGLIAAFGGIHQPAYEALTPQLVKPEEMALISPLIMFKSIFAALIGPALAGLLLSSFGAVFTYTCDVSSFVLSLLLLFKIKLPSLSQKEKEEQDAQRPSVLKDILEALLFLKSRKDILGSYLVDFFAMVFCMPQVLFPAFAAHYHQERFLGMLYGAVALGSFMISLLSGWTAQVKRLGIGIACAATGWALSIGMAGTLRGFWFIPIALFLAGACDGLSAIFRMTLWNESIPLRMRGRIASFGMISYMSGPLLGNSIMGLLADRVGLHQSLALGSLVSFTLVILVSFIFPQFRSYRSP